MLRIRMIHKPCLSVRVTVPEPGSVNKTDWDRMKEKAKSCGLQVVDVKSDGNCMFAALAHQLGRKAEDADVVRSEITAFMRQNELSMVIVIYDVLVAYKINE